jgi:nucleoside triphosphatase YtkD
MSEVIVKFHEHEQIANELLKFAVIMARRENKWIFCRHKERNTYEIPGGHREPGENIDQAAERELSEETGALQFSIEPVCFYSVTSKGETTYGKLYFAEIYELDSLPLESEIADICYFDAMPDKLTYPAIQPLLYGKIQKWLNLQSAKDELWDVYDSERNLTGRTHRRAVPMEKGDYHLGVHAWLQKSTGEFLITKRAPNKGYPNMWECTAGSAVAGDDSLAAVIREVKEETGLDVYPKNGKCVFTIKLEHCICDIWLFKQDFDIRQVVLQDNETIDAKYATVDEIRQMIKNGEFIASQCIDEYGYTEELFEIAKEPL